MSQSIYIPQELTGKAERYQALLPQIKALVQGEPDIIANLSNITAALKEGMGFFWIGFYMVKNNELVLGPFQGPVACTRIGYGKGVCGTAWKEKRVVVVDNINDFPGHIACNAASLSEIVLPVYSENEVSMVLDIDSDQLASFDSEDVTYLSEIIKIVEAL